MADFTSREADEADTDERLRERANREGGHTFGPGRFLCEFCEIGLDPIRTRVGAGHPVPRCSRLRPCPAHGQPACPVCLAAGLANGPDRRTGEERRGTSGNKYHRTIYGLKDAIADEGAVVVDVYSVLTAFAVTSPGLQHAAKKILCAGIRGKGDRVQDLTEARDALDRAIEDAKREAGR